MKNAVSLFHKDFEEPQPLGTPTLLARSSALYLYDRKIRKNPNPFPIWKIGFGLYRFGAVDGTGFSRLDAVRSAPLSGHTVA